MPQTLLGLLALALAAMLTLNNQQHQMGTYQDRLVDEYRLSASGLSIHIMEMIAARSFDEASTPLAIEARDGAGGNPIPDSTAFTATSGFGEMLETTDVAAGADAKVLARITGNNGKHKGFFKNYDPTKVECDLLTYSLACDDVDDMDGMRGEQVFIELSNGQRLEFEVDIDVYYVQKGAPETAVSALTSNKRVVLKLRTPDLPTYGDLVVLERVISYDPIKADRDHENLCGTFDGVDEVQNCIDNYVAS